MAEFLFELGAIGQVPDIYSKTVSSAARVLTSAFVRAELELQRAGLDKVPEAKFDSDGTRIETKPYPMQVANVWQKSVAKSVVDLVDSRFDKNGMRECTDTSERQAIDDEFVAKALSAVESLEDLPEVIKELYPDRVPTARTDEDDRAWLKAGPKKYPPPKYYVRHNQDNDEPSDRTTVKGRARIILQSLGYEPAETAEQAEQAPIGRDRVSAETNTAASRTSRNTTDWTKCPPNPFAFLRSSPASGAAIPTATSKTTSACRYQPRDAAPHELSIPSFFDCSSLSSSPSSSSSSSSSSSRSSAGGVFESSDNHRASFLDW